MEWYLKVLRNYVGFKGRARRKEYWMFVLINIVIAILLGIVDGILGWHFGENKESGVLSSLYSLGILLPSLAVLCRRLHDTDRSGWWILLPARYAGREPLWPRSAGRRRGAAALFHRFSVTWFQ